MQSPCTSKASATATRAKQSRSTRASLSKARWEDNPLAQVDLFRLENGKIVEHWDNSEPALPDEMNSGKF